MANENLMNNTRIDVVELHDAFDIAKPVCYKMVSPDLVKVAVFTPIARPNESNNGPPEFPGKVRHSGGLEVKKNVNFGTLSR